MRDHIDQQDFLLLVLPEKWPDLSQILFIFGSC